MQMRSSFVGVVLCLAFAGCATVSVTPISLLEAYSTATLFYGEPDSPRDQREVPIAELTAILARATWQSGSSASKGGFWLRYPNGRDLFVAVGFDFFRERGVSGKFVVRPEDLPRYQEVIIRLRR